MAGTTRFNQKSLKVGVIGAGWMSSIYHVPILSHFKETEIQYITDIDSSKAHDLANAYDSTSVKVGSDKSQLPDCDIALLAIPVGAREEYITELGERGIPVFCEKPFVVNNEMHDRFVNNGEALFCNYQRTCYSSINILKSIIQSGTFGELESAIVHEGLIGGDDAGIGTNHYRTDLELSGGGVLMEIGCHTLSEIVHIFEHWKLEVSDVDITWNDEFDIDVDADFLATGDQNSVEISYNISTIQNLGRKAKFSFEHADVLVDPWDAEEPLRVQQADSNVSDLTIEHNDKWATTHHEGVYQRWKQFVADLRGEQSTDHIRTGREVTELITEIYDEADRSREGI